MNKKKILYLRTDIYDKELIAGGSVSHTLGVIQGFLRLGYEVTYASSVTIPSVEQLLLIKIIKLKNPDIFKWLRWKLNCLLSNIFFTLQIMRLVREQKIDFMYQRYSLLNCSGVLVRSITKIPLILEYNGSEVWVNKHWVDSKKWLKLSWLSAKIELINLTRADSIIVVSQPLKDELIARGVKEDKILVNPNGVDTDYYDPARLAEQRAEVRKKLGIENSFVFGFIGTFSVWHGIELLAQIIPEIIRQRPKAHFLLIGDGPLKEMLQESLKKNNVESFVTFTGCVAQSEGKNYLAACDTFLCPTQPNSDGSRFFGSPTKLFEYLSMGRPIIASDLEQLSEIIQPAIKIGQQAICHLKEDALGFLITPRHCAGFITAALFLIDQDNETILKMGSCARERAIKNYSWNQHVQSIMELRR